MKISKTMVKYYLDYITVNYFGENSDPPADLAAYNQYLDSMSSLAELKGDLDWLQLALQYLLSNPYADLTEYRGMYPLQSDELRELFIHVWKTLWPEASVPSPGESVEVELVPMTVEDWDSRRRRYQVG